MLEISDLKEQLIQAAINNDLNEVRNIAKKSQQVDFAEVLGELNERLILRIFRMLNKEDETDIFSYLKPEIQEFIIRSFSSKEVEEIVKDLYSDDLVDLIDELPATIVKKVLRAASPKIRAEINNILKYEEDTAGGIMTVNFIEIKEKDSIEKTIKYVREIHEEFETIDTLFVLDDYGHLKGFVELKDLIFNSPKTKIKEIMETRLLYVNSTADQEEVANMFKRYDVTSIPVVDDSNKMIGIITVDDIVDVIEKETSEDINKMAGIKNDDQNYFDLSIFKMFKSRTFWLVILLVLGTITQILTMLFYNLYLGDVTSLDTNSKGYVGIVLMAPMAIVIAGVVGLYGSQSATIMMRALTLREVKKKTIKTFLIKESITTMLVALILIVVNIVRILIIYVVQLGEINTIVWELIGVSSVTILISIIVAGVIATLAPIIAKAMKLDPANATGPFITLMIDIITISVFFGIGLAFF
ncbi:magnesium transporter [Williamsoniiplasma luminosum]|uniref:Magnesium transporter MgtE n=1 Tax=Williamsoniiplasma luminosum TaxID=214888 RepID=A0A2S0NKB7_9MOLU|nr:magnesium transporter [Williamsoniiplasma luminosum]AVP49463.1 MAG: magnesium transporter [Williamsoniiplasma luminosum]